MAPDVIILGTKDVTEGLSIIVGQTFGEGDTGGYTQATREEGLERDNTRNLEILR